jgi:hypothetical protein
MNKEMSDLFTFQGGVEEVFRQTQRTLDLGETIEKNSINENTRDIVEASRMALCSFFAEYEM